MSKTELLWLGSEEAFRQYVQAEDKISNLTLTEIAELSERFMAAYPEEDREFGDMDYMVDLIDGLAVVSISGTLTNRDSPWNKYFGRVSYNEIRSAALEAANHPDTKSILLAVDSPGGAVTGLQETAKLLETIDQKVMPVYTHSGTVMASGGYWLGSVGREVYASELAEVGSIGVITVHQEITKMLEDHGIKSTVIRKGKFKALGGPYEKLSPEARAEIEKDMDFIYEVFTKAVSDHRGIPQQIIKDTAAEGQVFFAEAGKAVGLIDDVSTYDEVVNMLIARHNGSGNGLESYTPQGYGVEDMKRNKQVLTEAQMAQLASGVQVEGDHTDADLPEADTAGADVEDTTQTTEADDTEHAAPEANVDEGNTAEADVSDAPADSSKTTNQDAGYKAVIADLKETLAAKEAKIVELSVELSTLTKQAESTQAAVTGLTTIAVMAAERLQIALNQAPSTDAMKAMTPGALVEYFNKLNETFVSSFPVGAQAGVPDGEADHANPEQGVNQMDAARTAATKIK